MLVLIATPGMVARMRSINLRKISPLAFLLSSVLWFALMIVFWFLLPAIIYKRSATFKDKFKVSLLPDVFKIENDRGSRSWPWKDFSSFIESPHFFHLYFDSRSFFIVPKEAFEEDGVLEARHFLRTKIPQ